jgi:hypothetical protein
VAARLATQWSRRQNLYIPANNLCAFLPKDKSDEGTGIYVGYEIDDIFGSVHRPGARDHIGELQAWTGTPAKRCACYNFGAPQAPPLGRQGCPVRRRHRIGSSGASTPAPATSCGAFSVVGVEGCLRHLASTASDVAVTTGWDLKGAASRTASTRSIRPLFCVLRKDRPRSKPSDLGASKLALDHAVRVTRHPRFDQRRTQ